MDISYLMYLTVFVTYFIFGLTTFFYNKYLGTRGLFYTAEFILAALFIFSSAMLC